MRIVETRVVLQYSKEGELGEYYPITKDESEQFVALDDRSGGYPYAVNLQRAHDFRTEAEALRYRGHFKNVYHVRIVTVTYEFQ